MGGKNVKTTIILIGFILGAAFLGIYFFQKRPAVPPGEHAQTTQEASRQTGAPLIPPVPSEEGPAVEEKVDISEEESIQEDEEPPLDSEAVDEDTAQVRLTGPGSVARIGGSPTQTPFGNLRRAPPGAASGIIVPPGRGTPQNIPPHLPNPNLAGSPKIQLPASTTPPGGSSNSVATTPSGGNGDQATPPSPPQPQGSGEDTKVSLPDGVQVALQDQLAGGPGEGSLEGTLGAPVESAVLPGLDVLFYVLPGQAVEYDPFTLRDVDFQIKFMSDETAMYDETATARFFTERTYLENEVPDSFPFCEVNPAEVNIEIGKCVCLVPEPVDGKVKVTCQGDFPFVHGHMLRVIACGEPNQEVLNNFTENFGPSNVPLAAFMAQAWYQGDETLWNEDLCPGGFYVDYPFEGATAQITFPMVRDQVYFLVHYPEDYPGNETLYGEIAPSFLNMVGKYENPAQMSGFLGAGKIIQVIWGVQPPGVTSGETPPDSINISLASLNISTTAAVTDTGGVPNNQYCQPYADWEDSWVAQETALVQELNQARSQKQTCGGQEFEAANPLSTSPTLRCAARKHSQDMHTLSFFAHVNPNNQTNELNRTFEAGTQPAIDDGSGDSSRTGAGTAFAGAGENIAQGYTDPKEVVQEWLASDDHCANLMNPAFNYVGAGYHPGNPDENKPARWTAVFGTPFK